ncbi:maleylpyruvate isomerase family mycothiol-dependent enzyme [Nocardioides marmoribigeumensis]|uniref:Uncharacterized protein (TIGR03086 family) n=1 Tax=Nocardioides marmoribigeumensis TaxID=433649 RepID=A0ABU2C1M5_9ACTN|nr:maleylpyruvate isomerase family mycothiol-dependent enzyme [Nocardioides marmoribigeumensis]MDR7364563.1 uncharacterized protein (TIGR03086 family) [Nocardioides marmoribigeumensis]
MTALAERTALLGDAVAWTATTLPAAAVAAPDLPTPCDGWTLVDLLLHMDDALEAFHEASGGHVSPPVPRHPATPAALVERLRFSACRLLEAWSRPVPASVRVGEMPLPTSLLLDAAALEIAVHGWDLAVATGGPRLPESLAGRLLPVLDAVVDCGDVGPGRRFALPVPTPPAAPLDVVLLARLGRHAR